MQHLHPPGVFDVVDPHLLFKFLQIPVDRDAFKLLQVDHSAKLHHHHVLTLLLQLSDPLLVEFLVFDQLDMRLTCLPVA